MAQLLHRLNTQNWDIAAWEQAEAEAWRAKIRGEWRLRGDGGRRWPVSSREAKEAEGAAVTVDEEVRAKMKVVERELNMVAKGMRKVGEEVNRVGERMREHGKPQFVERWTR